MGQDAAGRPYLYALGLFVAAAIVGAVAFVFRRQVPGGPWVLGVAGAVVGVGVLFLLYVAFLALRSTSAKNVVDHEAYLKSTREADAGWSPVATTSPAEPGNQPNP